MAVLAVESISAARFYRDSRPREKTEITVFTAEARSARRRTEAVEQSNCIDGRPVASPAGTAGEWH
jgi:hypothetical protein